MGSERPPEGETHSVVAARLARQGDWAATTRDGDGLRAAQPGAAIEQGFQGDFVRWIGSAHPEGGDAVVTIRDVDGSIVDPPRIVDTRAHRQHDGQILFARYDLPAGTYRIEIALRDDPGGASPGSIIVERLEWGSALRGDRYIDSRALANRPGTGSGRSPDDAWHDLAALRGATLAPGCRIRLARGGIWSETLGPLHGAGHAGQPIVIEAYGEGPRPHLRLGGRPSDRAVWLNDPSHWTVRDLEVSGAGAGIVAYYTSNGHRGLRFEDIETHDNDAIHWHDSRDWVPQADLPGMYHGAAILITGRVPVTPTESAVEDVRFERIRSQRDVDPIDICGFNPRLGNLEFLSTNLGTHAVRGIHIRDCELRDGKGGLNFDNVEDLSIVGTHIKGMCVVPQIIGTTGLFLWSVDRVTIANSILSDVPDTGSVDGTGCDLEAYTRRVRFLGDFFARNAAAGIEMLAIEVGGRPVRPGDHCIEHEVLGCGFSDNLRKHRPDRPSEQLGSIHLRNDTDAPFSGWTNGNLSADRFPLVDVAEGRSIPDWHAGRDLQVAPGALFSAADAFGPDAAGQGWRYERRSEEARTSLRWDPVRTAWVDDEVVVSRFETRPANDASTWVARTWVAPWQGRVAVRGYVLVDAGDRDGAQARITHAGKILGSLELAEDVRVGELVGASLDLDDVEVQAGDRLGFEVRGAPVSWSPLIGYVAVDPS